MNKSRQAAYVFVRGRARVQEWARLAGRNANEARSGTRGRQSKESIGASANVPDVVGINEHELSESNATVSDGDDDGEEGDDDEQSQRASETDQAA